VTCLQDSEEELPDMSDEQMFKMDKLLAAVLRTQKDAKDRTKNSKQVGSRSSEFGMETLFPKIGMERKLQTLIPNIKVYPVATTTLPPN
jgi:hypothetical protein